MHYSLYAKLRIEKMHIAVTDADVWGSAAVGVCYFAIWIDMYPCPVGCFMTGAASILLMLVPVVDMKEDSGKPLSSKIEERFNFCYPQPRAAVH